MKRLWREVVPELIQHCFSPVGCAVRGSLPTISGATREHQADAGCSAEQPSAGAAPTAIARPRSHRVACARYQRRRRDVPNPLAAATDPGDQYRQSGWGAAPYRHRPPRAPSRGDVHGALITATRSLTSSPRVPGQNGLTLYICPPGRAGRRVSVFRRRGSLRLIRLRRIRSRRGKRVLGRSAMP